MEYRESQEVASETRKRLAKELMEWRLLARQNHVAAMLALKGLGHELPSAILRGYRGKLKDHTYRELTKLLKELKWEERDLRAQMDKDAARGEQDYNEAI